MSTHDHNHECSHPVDRLLSDWIVTIIERVDTLRKERSEGEIRQILLMAASLSAMRSGCSDTAFAKEARAAYINIVENAHPAPKRD